MRSRKNNMTPLDPARVVDLWLDTTLGRDDICELLGCSYTKVRTVALDLGLPSARLGGNTGRRPADPTPDEIASACREIQAGWTDEERNARAGVSPRLHVFSYTEGR